MVENLQPQLQKHFSQVIKISVDDILDKFDCPICMCKLAEPYIAKCGHTFCKGCISECVNRQHECPSCRAKLTKDDLFRNYTLEVLLQKLTEEKEKETQKYFNDLASNALHQEKDNKESSPIETVFLLNLRESLLSYQEYFEGLIKEKDAVQKKIKTGLGIQLMGAKQGGNIADQNSINKQISEQMMEIEMKFQGAIDTLIQSYDEHMKKILPKPKLLPIRISVAIESKPGLKIENIHIKPYDNINDLLKMIEEHQQLRGDPILDWNKANIQFQLTGPLRLDNQMIAEPQQQEDFKMEIDEVDQMSMNQLIIIRDWNVPFSKYNMAAGSMITIKGGPVKFNSDKPLECMTLLYDKDPKATFNYFSCKTCGTNWICQSCKEGCHQGHTLLPHLLNHRPTWACCYCMKKDLCKIANKKYPHGKK